MCKMFSISRKFYLLVTKCIFTLTYQKSATDFFSKKKTGVYLVWNEVRVMGVMMFVFVTAPE